MSPTRIPLTILAGFLGSGKTTLLNNILRADHGVRIAVLVNDFGAINIDSQLIVGVEGDTISLSNGCICCSIRGDLIEATEKLLARPDLPEYIIIETSGVSDPAQVAHTFTHTALARRVRLDSVLTVIDAEQIGTLKDEHALLALDQVGIADIVIVNKVDLVNDDERAAVRAWIHEISPRARILETTYGDVPMPLVLGVGAFDPARLDTRTPREVHVHGGEAHDHDHPHDHTLVFSTWYWQSEQPVSLKALKRLVNDLPESIYRAKGVFHLADQPDKRAVFQMVGKRASLVLTDGGWGDAVPHSQVVVIAAHDGFAPDALQAQFEACLAANAHPSELEKITGGVMNWLRGRR
jgi:G3E family GTPase